MSRLNNYFASSIGKKQTVATTGLFLIIYVVVHLAGNLLIYRGPEPFNFYADVLASLRPGLYVIEAVLLFAFLIHVYFTALLVQENIQARKLRYEVYRDQGNRSLATRLMPLTGTFLLLFILWHIKDFTFTDHHGIRSILADGKSYGLYGVVYNSFMNPVHSGLYIFAMWCLGLHLSHGVQSFCQTFGFNHPRYTPVIRNISNGFGVLIALGYSTIPVWVLFRTLNHTTP